MSRNPTERFSGRVENYVRYRPRYTRELISLLREHLGLEPSWIVADIGSGTGFSAEPFLEFGNTVIGVEPNREMREAAQTVLAAWPRFISRAGTAEATGLQPESIDLVVAGQAFHWFDPPKARTEFRRILKPGGSIALFWNTRRTDSSPFLKAYEALLLRYGTDYQQVRHDRIGPDVLQEFFEGKFELQVIPNEQIFDFEALKGRLLSSSYVPDSNDPRREQMIRELETIFNEFNENGRVSMEYDTEVWMRRMKNAE